MLNTQGVIAKKTKKTIMSLIAVQLTFPSLKLEALCRDNSYVQAGRPGSDSGNQLTVHVL